MTLRLLVLPGDGVGPEVCAAALEVLRSTEIPFEHDFLPIGADCYEKTGRFLPEDAFERIEKVDAVFVGAVGHPDWENSPIGDRPEQSLLAVRKTLRLFANLRPVSVRPFNSDASQETTHMDIFRELIGGAYYGEPRGIQTLSDGNIRAHDTIAYTSAEIQRFARFVLRHAQGSSARVLSVDKANVLHSSRLWRQVVTRTRNEEFESVELEHMHADAAAFELLREPGRWGIVMAPNLFGDLLSDELAIFSRSIGMLPSASLGDTGPYLYEPVHGTAPTIAGLGIANPVGAILSMALLLRYTAKNEQGAQLIESAVDRALTKVQTRDLGGEASTVQMTRSIITEMETINHAIH